MGGWANPEFSVCVCECVFVSPPPRSRVSGGGLSGWGLRAEHWGRVRNGNEQRVRIWGDVSTLWGARGLFSAFSSCNTEPAWLCTHLHPCGSHGKVINTPMSGAEIFGIPEPAGVGIFQELLFLRNPAAHSPPGKQNKMRA